MTRVNIRVASDTVLYLPLYMFVQWNSTDSHREFDFHLEPVRQNIILDSKSSLEGVGPIEYDPVFSPITDPNRFLHFPRDWFGVGDPLRMRRFKQYKSDKGHELPSYWFVGSLIDRMAFWLVQADTFSTREDLYQLVSCHPPGMTGFYLCEYLYQTQECRPLFPVTVPGSEVELFMELLNIDRWRLANENRVRLEPARIAAVTTEIGRVLDGAFRTNRSRRPVITSDIGKQLRERKGINDHFLMTAIVAREENSSPQRELVESAAQILKTGIQKVIARLKSGSITDEKWIISTFKDFYRSHGAFRPPLNDNLLWIRSELITKLVDKIARIYPDKLVARGDVRESTDELLRAVVKQEIARKAIKMGRKSDAPEIKTEAEAVFNTVQTSTWDNSSTLFG